MTLMEKWINYALIDNYSYTMTTRGDTIWTRTRTTWAIHVNTVIKIATHGKLGIAARYANGYAEESRQNHIVMIVILKISKEVVMFRIGDKVIIKYRPPLYMKGYIDYALPVGVIVSGFGNGVYGVGLNTGDEYIFDEDQLELEEEK